MSGNEYEGVFEKREVELIRWWANQAGFQPSDVPDLLQEAAIAVIQRPNGWPQASGTERRQLLWAFTKSTSGRIKRSEGRQQQRDEQKALMVDEAYCDNATPIRLDVQEVVAGLDERCQTVCQLLSEGLSKLQIAEQMQCSWHAVDRLVQTVRLRLEEAEVDAWLQ